jgi:uncharacterized protein with von Willebrand factor type A (vWA) domain
VRDSEYDVFLGDADSLDGARFDGAHGRADSAGGAAVTDGTDGGSVLTLVDGRGAIPTGGASAARPADRDATVTFVGFARALAAAGLRIGPGRTATFLRAVAALDVTDPRNVYWAGRAVMAAEPDDLPVYDAVFAHYFSGRARSGLAPRARTLQPTTAILPLTDEPGGDGEEGEDGDAPVVKARASRRDVLRARDMARLTAEERAELSAMIALLRPGLPTRRSRRRHPAHLGAVDRRRTVRAMLAAGGEPARPPRHRVGTRPRRIVLLVDVSGSMAPYADPLLRFAHVLVRQRPFATEVFTIGTRLSRVTRALTQRDPDTALAAASVVIPDFSGGTRLGEVLKAFNDRWGQRGTAHGAIVVIFSDGWERGSCDLLGDQVTRLQRLARSVVWVNPHKGHDGYLPVQSGIVAALPHIDHFVAGHSLATLEELLEVIRGA